MIDAATVGVVALGCLALVLNVLAWRQVVGSEDLATGDITFERVHELAQHGHFITVQMQRVNCQNVWSITVDGETFTYPHGGVDKLHEWAASVFDQFTPDDERYRDWLIKGGAS